jgi:hypothetical protein
MSKIVSSGAFQTYRLHCRVRAFLTVNLHRIRFQLFRSLSNSVGFSPPWGGRSLDTFLTTMNRFRREIYTASSQTPSTRFPCRARVGSSDHNIIARVADLDAEHCLCRRESAFGWDTPRRTAIDADVESSGRGVSTRSSPDGGDRETISVAMNSGFQTVSVALAGPGWQGTEQFLDVNALTDNELE